jgi:acetyl esterase/lipase
VCPGGNYEFLVPHEGFPVVDLLERHGIRAFVLRYRLLPKYKFAESLDDLRTAVEQVRCNFDGPVGAVGFSAGGHLIASLALRMTGANAALKPLDAQVLVYPAIDGTEWGQEDNCGFWDFKNCFPAAKSLLADKEALLGGKGFAAPPTFLVASTGDETSPPKDHTDKYAEVLKQRRIPYQYMRRNFGAHGFGIAGGWTKQCVTWLKGRGFGIES